MSKDKLTQAEIHNKPDKQAKVQVCETSSQKPWNQTSNDPPATAYDSQLAGKILVPVKTS